MATNGVAVVEDRAGITFGVELYVPWDAPEVGKVQRKAVCYRAETSAVYKFWSPIVFHDIAIVDMGDVPESHIPLSELSTLSQQWPPAVISHMGWRQQELEEMRAAA